MIRPLTLLAVLAMGLSPALAQEAAPAAPATPAVDPAATFAPAPKATNLLTGLYATKAVIELCTLPVDAAILEGIAIDTERLQTSLSMDAATSEEAYDKIKADVGKTGPDCAEGSTDRVSVDAVTAIYAERAAAAAAPTATPPAPASDATAAPAPAETPAPAPAAQ